MAPPWGSLEPVLRHLGTPYIGCHASKFLTGQPWRGGWQHSESHSQRRTQWPERPMVTQLVSGGGGMEASHVELQS